MWLGGIRERLKKFTHTSPENITDPFPIACRRRGVAVLMVHHAGKGGEQRGTGAREGHLDTSIKLFLSDEASSNDSCYFRVDFTKSRGCYGQDIEPFTAKLQENPYGETEWTIASILLI
jgi:putative DNA primase/helicase